MVSVSFEDKRKKEGKKRSSAYENYSSAASTRHTSRKKTPQGFQ
jgi:hypothetical protein